MWNWLRHAFSVETTGPAIPSPSQAAIIDVVCREIVRRQMVLPVRMLLESSAPLNFLAGQLLRFVEPFLGTVLDPAAVRDFAAFVEQRGAVEYICRRLEELQVADEQTPQ
jgi:hypothetical protein